MACISTLLPHQEDYPCKRKRHAWGVKGVVTWIGDGEVSPCFKLGDQLYTMYTDSLPDFVKIGNEIEISCDGENTTIGLVAVSMLV